VAQDVEEQVALGARLVDQRLGMGDQVHEPRPIDHVAGFRSRKGAQAAGEELVAHGYRIDGLRRRFLTVWLEFSAMSAVDHVTAAAFTREVVGIVNRHGGSYDGWGGFVVAADDEADGDA
jgi:hypothetical protein